MSDNTGGPAFPIHGNGMFGEPVTLKQGMTLLDWYAGQALAGLCANPGGPIQANGSAGWGFTNCDQQYVVALSYDLASAMLAEKARRETDHSGDANKMVTNHSPDAGRMVWKQSPRMSCAIICETQFSALHSDDENVEAYGGFLVAESVPEEAKALIIRAPQLEAANRELVEFVQRLAAFPLEEFGWQDRKGSQPIHAWNDYTLYVSDIKRARNLIAKHKGAA